MRGRGEKSRVLFVNAAAPVEHVPPVRYRGRGLSLRVNRRRDALSRRCFSLPVAADQVRWRRRPYPSPGERNRRIEQETLGQGEEGALSWHGYRIHDANSNGSYGRTQRRVFPSGKHGSVRRQAPPAICRRRKWPSCLWHGGYFLTLSLMERRPIQVLWVSLQWSNHNQCGRSIK